jgi:Helix-turn-helix domain
MTATNEINGNSLVPTTTPPPSDIDTSADGDQESDPHFHLLTDKQQQAMEWLMGGGTITEAAELVGVTRRTLSRWVNDNPDFSQTYQRWQEQVRTSAEGRMVGLVENAVDNLIAAVRERGDVKASQFVLKLLGVGRRSNRF